MVRAGFHQELGNPQPVIQRCVLLLLCTRERRDSRIMDWLGARRGFCLISATYKLCDPGQVIQIPQNLPLFICEIGRTIPASEGCVRFTMREVLPGS